MTRNSKASLLFAIACVVVITINASRLWFPVVTEHELRIEWRVSKRQWWIVDREHPKGFMYYACDDFDNESWIYAGYFAITATWKVINGCNSIHDQGMEFDYIWKPDGTAETIKEAGYE